MTQEEQIATSTEELAFTPLLLSGKNTTLETSKMASGMQSPFSSQQQGPSGLSQQQGFTSGAAPSMQQFTGQMTGGLERMREWLQNWIQNSADTLRVYVNQYPPLAAFLFTLLILSAVPVSVYVIFGLVTSTIFLTIALIGFSFVEGFVLLTSGGILMTVLGSIALFTTIGFAFISAIYIGYRGTSYLASNLWQASGQIGGQVRESMQRAGQPGGAPGSYGSSYGQSSGMMGGSAGATSS